MRSSSFDEVATRAAARALYEGHHAQFDVMSDAAITAALATARRPLAPMRIVTREPMPAPRPDAGQIETILRSAPQICAHCRLLSDEPARSSCPSPRGHYFVTDYVAMAEKVRAML